MPAADLAAARLSPRHGGRDAARVAASATAPVDAGRIDAVRARLAHAAGDPGFRVDRVPFSDLAGWGFTGAAGALVHDSGRFFSVAGLRVRTDTGAVNEWSQPIIHQPEVGILGILAKRVDGVLRLLMQVKMEPGNPNLVQLSPTVQATHSNYTRAHRGRPVRFLEYFIRPRRVLADVLQSEHGSWFYGKRNRNMIVEVTGDVPGHPDFHWLTVAEIGALLRHDNLVNMDARTVLACAPLPPRHGRAAHSDVELLSWFTGERTRRRVHTEPLPLGRTPGWERTADCIRHEAGRYFRVVGVDVRAATREVHRWTQPLIEPVGRGVVAFLTREIDGVAHVLAHARTEGGFRDTVELGPTVQCDPGSHRHLPPAARPAYLDAVLNAPPERVRYRAVHAEEGGRLLNAENSYLVVEASGPDARRPPPPDFRWVTPDQLGMLVRHGQYVNVQARTLLACINTGAARLTGT
ncbi:NDP-hexose 2,3-dehydratase family protein [Nocardiopsis mangrovi]|uniref:NDP-hexose 2,3-dehydratase family protein n=1 Tax=Nocardiopsis mangrovi TaxID=1179818 RepID=A0ABV9DRA6_9ACTN